MAKPTEDTKMISKTNLYRDYTYDCNQCGARFKTKIKTNKPLCEECLKFSGFDWS